jgi:hypothetical protein
MAHLDTVSSKDRDQEILKTPSGIIYSPDCQSLGADDGAGCAILADMIRKDVPALYLFTLAEETGGLGAEWIASNESHRLDALDRCISFDRRGTDDICQEQFIGTLASDEFTDAVIDALGMDHRRAQGTYTDSSEFPDWIPEIVNISVGYDANHSPKETLDFVYWSALRDRVMQVDWESLPCIGVPQDSRRSSRASAFTFADEWDGWDQDAVLIDTLVVSELQDLSIQLDLAPGSWEYSILEDALYRVASNRPR